MKSFTILLFITSIFYFSCSGDKENNRKSKYRNFDDYPVYNRGDLGLTYSPDSSVFKVWSPEADSMALYIYNDNDTIEAETFKMQIDSSGVWLVTVEEDLKGKYYNFSPFFGNSWRTPTVDPYVKAVGINGTRGYITDVTSIKPPGWENYSKPEFKNIADAVIYEIHIRDFSINSNSGIKNKGKYLAFTETGTVDSTGAITGLDHLKSLEVTHINLLPVFDFKSVDESEDDSLLHYNWGYDPQNFNVPEGSYSTNAADPELRILEFKKMVQTLHGNGLKVIMDVVYNHTAETETSVFNSLVPDYYYRKLKNGKFSDGSGAGNETNSERFMFRKFMLESLKYWMQEYHIDGFRFNLMALHDLESMQMIQQELNKIDSTVLLYGEGWTSSMSTLAEEKRTSRENVSKVPGIAVFNDEFRDGLKGSWVKDDSRGFLSADTNSIESVKFGIVAAVYHPQVDYSKVNYSDTAWALYPQQSINNVSSHYNYTLYDKLKRSNPNSSEEDIKKMHVLGNLIVLTSQGIPFLHGGVEFLRTKKGEEKSFQSPDSINQIDWSLKSKHMEVFEFYKNLISLRKNHPAFRMQDRKQIQKHIEFMEIADPGLIAYQIKENANKDSWKNILLIFNGSARSKDIELPAGEWNLAVSGISVNEAAIEKGIEGKYSVPSYSGLLFFQE